MHDTTNPTDAATITPNRSGETTLTVLALGLAMLLGALLWGTLNQPARAEVVAETGHLVALTAHAGDADILYMLDNRVEQLMLYKVTQQDTIELVQSLDLPELFRSARARRLGGD
jgi:hypothetical protein